MPIGSGPPRTPGRIGVKRPEGRRYRSVPVRARHRISDRASQHDRSTPWRHARADPASPLSRCRIPQSPPRFSSPARAQHRQRSDCRRRCQRGNCRALFHQRATRNPTPDRPCWAGMALRTVRRYPKRCCPLPLRVPPSHARRRRPPAAGGGRQCGRAARARATPSVH